MIFYTDRTVWDAALERIRMLFDEHGDVIVAMSGGKDSTVIYEMAKMVAKEKGRLPLKVLWLDQEAEWQSTVDYIKEIMYSDDVTPFWFQIPFDFTNSLSNKHNYLQLWDEAEKDKWIHPKDEIAYWENPTKETRFHKLLNPLAEYAAEDENTAVLCGIRREESLVRRYLTTTGAKYKHGVTWATKKYGNCQRFYPIWDWENSDDWVAIANNNWKYNALYDKQYKYGLNPRDMRCSALIHETAYENVRMLQEFEPETYKRFEQRVHGISAMSHALDTELVPKELPFAFKDWKEYRDYLLEHIVEPQYRDMFRKRWEGQDSDVWYRIHVTECIVQDIDGTKNQNQRMKERWRKRKAERGIIGLAN